MLKNTCIQAGWLIDGTGNHIQKNVLIHIQQYTIQTIEPAQNAACLKQSSFLDLSEYTLLPRLVDCHVHLFMSGTNNIVARKRQLEAGYDEQKTVISEHIARHLSSGVGAVRDGGDSKGLVQQYQQECPGSDGGEKPLARSSAAPSVDPGGSPSFPSGGGAMGALMRQHDCGTTPLSTTRVTAIAYTLLWKPPL